MATVTPSRPRLTAPLPVLRVAPVSNEAVAGGWPPVWWVGCHGGAGVSTLARLTGLGADLGTCWPLTHESWATQPVVLVTRATATGLRAATGAVEQWRGRAVLGVRVLGVVVIAASPRRPPKIVTDRIRLLAGWVPAVWSVGWQQPLLAADDPLDVGVAPDVDAVRIALVDILTSEAGVAT